VERTTFPPNRRAVWGAVLLAALVLGAFGCASALKDPSTIPGLPHTSSGPEDVDLLLAQAERQYAKRKPAAVSDAVELWLNAAAAGPQRIEGLVGAVRGRIWISGKAARSADRKSAAVSAVQVGQLCEQRRPESGECAYWLALALGVQARERQTTGLDALPIMVELLDKAAERVPELDHAGPDRVLALVYLRAPGWPSGVGDADRGLVHARRAVDRFADYPPNRLSLAEALVETGDPAAGHLAYRQAAKLARKWLDRGDPDAGEWLEQAEKGEARR
jgi:hypothetical protein